MIGLISRILKISGKYRRKIEFAFVFSFIKSMLMKAPIALSIITFRAFYTGTINSRFCLLLAVGLFVCVLLQAIAQNISDRLQSGAGLNVFADMRLSLGEHLRKMPMGYFTEGNLGKISSVLSTDMVFVEENCMNVIADLISAIFSQGIIVVFIAFIHPLLAGGTLLMLVLISWTAGKMQTEDLTQSEIRQNQSEKLTDAVIEFTEGITIAKAYNLLGEKSAELTENFEESCRASIQFEESHAPWQRRLNILYGIGMVMILALSFFLLDRGQLEAIALAGLLLFIFDLFGPIKLLYGQRVRLTVMNSCLDRIEAVFAEKELADDGQSQLVPQADQPAVQFNDVSFAYGEKQVLGNVSFTLEKNSMLALVGPSGGGKSTIANLLARFWDINSGDILVEGRNIREMPVSALMDHISMVFQRVYLFQDTVYNNIIMGRPDATEEEVMEAAKKARCYDFIMALPEGFQTIIGEGGASLSGGEKQRISIARCILKDAPLVILDEATASVDVDNERYIQEAITELCQGKTLLVIAHRLNTIRHADQILVIEEGRIAESGTHEALMDKGGIYKDFVGYRENTYGWNNV